MTSKGNTIIWAIVACLLWSTAYAGIKLGLQYDTPFHFAGIRFMISGLLVMPFAIARGGFLKMIRDYWKLISMVTVLQIVVNYSLFYLGLGIVPGALGAVIAGSQPLVTAIIASMMHEGDRLTRTKVITIVCGLSGVILISAGRQALKMGSSIELIGVVMILMANISLTMGNILVSLKSGNIHPSVLSSVTLFAGGLIIFLISIPVEGLHHKQYPAEYWMILSWLSFMAAAAFSIWFGLLKRPGVKVSELNLWKFIIPVAGAVISWLTVPGESPEWLTISGMVIITGSLFMFFRNNNDSVPVK